MDVATIGVRVVGGHAGLLVARRQRPSPSPSHSPPLFAAHTRRVLVHCGTRCGARRKGLRLDPTVGRGGLTNLVVTRTARIRHWARAAPPWGVASTAAADRWAAGASAQRPAQVDSQPSPHPHPKRASQPPPSMRTGAARAQTPAAVPKFSGALVERERRQ